MNLKFIKMHGTGNDFIMINGFNHQINNLNKVAKIVCDRHFGIGGDGLILILPPERNENDYNMKIFNSDGSEAEMCGNGIRCFAHFLKKENLTNKSEFRIETLAGIICPKIIGNGDMKSQVKVNMGKPNFKAEEIPVNLDSNLDYLKEYPLEIEGHKFYINCVSMGNPHSIIFVEDIDKYSLEKWGPLIENQSIFPEKANVEFIKIIKKDEIIMKVWERGSGITLACGTGATASVVAGIKNGLLDNKVLVHLPGGDLVIEWFGNNAYMTGPAETAFTGEVIF